MKILLVAVCFTSLTAFANHHEEMKAENFEEKKSMMLKHIDMKISHLTEMKSCVSGAKDHSGLKSCKEKMKGHHEEMKEHRQEMKGKMKENREEMKKAWEEQKKNKKK